MPTIRSYRRTTLIALACVFVLFGIALARVGYQADQYQLAATFTILVLLHRTRWLLPALCLVALSIGLWRGAAYSKKLASFEYLYGQKLVVTGTVVDDPGTSEEGYMLFNLSRVSNGNQPIPGRIRVRSHRATLSRGYRIQASGKFQPTLGNYAGEIVFAQVDILSDHQNWLESFRQRFIAGMRTALPDPLSGLALGLLVGTRSFIAKSLRDSLTIVGLSHIIAVSGYNLTILANAAERFGKSVSKYLSIAMAFWLTGFFMIISGFSASIVRASIVTVLSLLATYYGRKFKPWLLVLLPAVSTALYDPGYLIDLGWQLSFLAFIGIMILAPAISTRFRIKTNIGRLAVESLAAQLLTFPLILLIFGKVSLVSPLANLLVLPLVPLAMALGAIAGGFGMLLPNLSGLAALPALGLIGGIAQLVRLLASWPWASQNLSATPLVIFAIYALIAGLIFLLHQTANQKPAKV